MLTFVVMICRSGAVEQLRVHVRNLSMLGGDTAGRVELFERGYGKDAAGIAKEAITYGKPCPAYRLMFSEFFLLTFIAKDNDFDVVLIDTAGRMQDNEVSRLIVSPIRLLLIVFIIIATHASSSQSKSLSFSRQNNPGLNSNLSIAARSGEQPRQDHIRW